jgi:hypothetical protein
MISPAAPYIHICVFFETPKVGKKEGRKLSEYVCVGSPLWVTVVPGTAIVVVAVTVDWTSSVGFGFVGLSIWSVGFPGSEVGGLPGSMLVVLTTADAVS